MVNFLTRIGLTQENPDYKGSDRSKAPHVITSKGYEFMLHDANEFMLHDANAQLPLASSLPGTDPSKRARSSPAMLTVDDRPNATMPTLT